MAGASVGRYRAFRLVLRARLGSAPGCVKREWMDGNEEVRALRRVCEEAHGCAGKATATRRAPTTRDFPAGAAGERVRAKPATAAGKSRAARPAAAAGTVSAAVAGKRAGGGGPAAARRAGESAVQSFIAALPEWQAAFAGRIDAMIGQAVPGAHKALRWNTPLYGMEEGRWFLGVHVFLKVLRVAFHRGTSLRPPPPGDSCQREVRYLDLREGDRLDRVQFMRWVKQASRLPGVRL